MIVNNHRGPLFSGRRQSFARISTYCDRCSPPWSNATASSSISISHGAEFVTRWSLATGDARVADVRQLRTGRLALVRRPLQRWKYRRSMGEAVYIIHHLLDERTRLVHVLNGEPVIVKSHDSGEQFLDGVTSTASGCVLVSLDLPGMGIRSLMVEINRRDLALAVVVLGHVSEFAGAVELVRAGAFDFLEIPISGGRVRSVVRRAIGAGI